MHHYSSSHLPIETCRRLEPEAYTLKYNCWSAVRLIHNGRSVNACWPKSNWKLLARVAILWSISCLYFCWRASSSASKMDECNSSISRRHCSMDNTMPLRWYGYTFHDIYFMPMALVRRIDTLYFVSISFNSVSYTNRGSRLHSFIAVSNKAFISFTDASGLLTWRLGSCGRPSTPRRRTVREPA
ncbi:hypothetical protein B0H19DRAFT_1099821 [Mycena capillaripes]|nr:hypothetical protein B0H19DRAFT_1099821 [Mycena capillaripes]